MRLVILLLALIKVDNWNLFSGNGETLRQLDEWKKVFLINCIGGER